MTAFDDYFAKMMPDVEAWFAEHAAQPVTGQPVVVPELVSARKLSAVIHVPDEYLMAIGVIPDTRPKPKPPTWRTRLRRRAGAWREQAARRAFKVIAGYEVPEREDW